MADPTNETNPPPREGAIPDPNASQHDQILGVAAEAESAREKIDAKWRGYYDRLIELKDRLIDASTDLTQKAREISPDPIQDSPAEIGTSEFQRDQLLGTVTYDSETLEEVTAAISRIENGTYGICEATGKPIAPERLEAVPWARFSTEAQREMEEKGETTQAAIGPLGRFSGRGTAPAGPHRDQAGST